MILLVLYSHLLAAISGHTVGLKTDSTVGAVGENDNGNATFPTGGCITAWRSRRNRSNAGKRRTSVWKRKRAKQVAALNAEKAALQKELGELKGLFTGKLQREIEMKLAEIEREIVKYDVS